MLVLHGTLVSEKICKKDYSFLKITVRFCLQLDKNNWIGVAEFKEINWLNINGRFSQCILSGIYKFFNSESPEYFNEI